MSAQTCKCRLVERGTQLLNEQSISPPKNTRGHTQKAIFPVFNPRLTFRGRTLTTTIERHECAKQGLHFLQHPCRLVTLSLSSLLVVVVDLPVSCGRRLPRRSMRCTHVRRWLLLPWRRGYIARSSLLWTPSGLIWMHNILRGGGLWP